MDNSQTALPQSGRSLLVVDSANKHIVVQFSEHRLSLSRKSREKQSSSILRLEWEWLNHFDCHIPAQAVLQILQHVLFLAFGKKIDFADFDESAADVGYEAVFAGLWIQP